MAQRKSSDSKKKVRENNAENKAVLLIVFAIIAIILELCLFGILGKFGGWIATGEFGLFGVMAYIFPIAAMALIIYKRFEKGNYKKVLITGIVLFFLLCAFMQLCAFPDIENIPVKDFFTRCAGERVGGGIFGGLISIAFVLVISRAGAFVVVILAILACIFIICQNPIVSGAKKIINSKRGYIESEKDEDDAEEDEAPDKRVVPRSKIRSLVSDREPVRKTPGGYFRAQREIPVYEATDDEGRTIRIVNAVHPKKRARAELKRSANKSIPYRNGNTEILRSESKIRGINQNLNMRDNYASGDEIHEITNAVIPNMYKDEAYDTEGDINAIKITDIPDFADEAKERPVAQKPERAKPINSKPADKITTDTLIKNTDDFSGEAKDREIIKNKKTASGKFFDIVEAEPESRQKVSGRNAKKTVKPYEYPPLKLLNKGEGKSAGMSSSMLKEMAQNLVTILETYGVNTKITAMQAGPSVTRFELQPELGTRVSKITSLAEDLKLHLSVPDIRIEAPIPGRAAIGIEIPNADAKKVVLRDLLEDKKLQAEPSKIAIAAGVDISGNVVTCDIDKMPHLLIAGTTGSGKSVFTKSLLMTILFRAKPEEVGIIIIDPKQVEFNAFSGIPHMMKDVVTDSDQAISTLRWANAEMDNRYQRMRMSKVNEIKAYNEKFEKGTLSPEEEMPRKMQQIVIIIDELADLMMRASKEVETLIVRLAQLARAAGMHLIIATQRPSANIVTGLIKANVPSKAALRVTSKLESRIIIDMQGAEELLGHGDMLFFPNGLIKPLRVQGAMITEEEVYNVTQFLKSHSGEYIYSKEAQEIQNFMNNASDGQTGIQGADSNSNDKLDEYIFEAGKLCIEAGKASSSMLQRRFSIGFNRAARIIDQLCDLGVVGPQNGAKPREILMDTYEFEMRLQNEDE